MVDHRWPLLVSPPVLPVGLPLSWLLPLSLVPPFSLPVLPLLLSVVLLVWPSVNRWAGTAVTGGKANRGRSGGGANRWVLAGRIAHVHCLLTPPSAYLPLLLPFSLPCLAVPCFVPL